MGVEAMTPKQRFLAALNGGGRLDHPALAARAQAIADARKELADARSAQKGAHLKGAVDVRSIIKKADALPEVEKVALGPDFDDEEEVPPLQ